MKMLGLGKKGASFDTYTSPDYTKLRDLLYNVSSRGFPEIQNLATQGFREEIMPGIRELYEGRRNLGIGSTPEISALGQAGRGLERDVAGQNIQARLNALNMLQGITPRPMTTYQAPYEPLQDLLSGGLGLGANLASSYFGSKMQSQALKDVFGSGGFMGGGNVKGKDYGKFYSDMNNEEFNKAIGGETGNYDDLFNMGADVASLYPPLTIPAQLAKFGYNLFRKNY